MEKIRRKETMRKKNYYSISSKSWRYEEVMKESISKQCDNNLLNKPTEG